VSVFANLLSTLGIRRVDLRREALRATGPLADCEFLVPNMVCEGCAERISGALISVPGVREVNSKVPQKGIRVRYEPGKVREQELRDALGRIGFTVLDA
jgi:copper chaperone CopZ